LGRREPPTGKVEGSISLDTIVHIEFDWMSRHS
jgi:hypothetical protein